MHRRYTDAPTIRKVLQTLWHQVNNGQEIYVIGTILDDGTVRGGTGWGAEFAKLCNKPLQVFDLAKDGWFTWADGDWRAQGSTGGPFMRSVRRRTTTSRVGTRSRDDGVASPVGGQQAWLRLATLSGAVV